MRVELGARSDTEPREHCDIEPDIARAIPAAVDSGRVTVRVVSAKRTFIEKAMLLHEQVCPKTPRSPRPRLSRHYYDLYCLIRAGIADEAWSPKGYSPVSSSIQRSIFRSRYATSTATTA